MWGRMGSLEVQLSMQLKLVKPVTVRNTVYFKLLSIKWNFPE